MNELRLLAERAQRAAADPAASAWVGASAGTGKTKVLTDRVLNLLLTGTAPERILCLTFTKAAAAEMANRLADRLARWAILDEDTLRQQVTALSGIAPADETLGIARRLFARVLDTPGGMKIETIHAFGQSLLRRFPLEAGVSAHFEVLDDRDAADLLARAREDVLTDASPTVAAALARLTALVHELAFPDLLAALTTASGKIGRMFQGFGGRAGAERAIRRRLGLLPGETAEGIRAAACADSAFDRAGLLSLADTLSGLGGSTDKGVAATLHTWLALPDADARGDGWDEYLTAFLTKSGEPRAQSRFPSKAVKEARPDLLDVIDRETERLLRAEERWRAGMVAESTAALLTVAEAMLAAYAAAKQRRGRLDYDDLINATRRLLSTSDAAAWVLYKLDGGLDHVLVDEAQDTNPDQWAVIAALTEEFFAGLGAQEQNRTVFAVGDRKQSIYSFQGADPDEFDRQRARVAEAGDAVGARFADVKLQVSFRSTTAVLDIVDQVFAAQPAASGVATDDEPVSHYANRQQQGGLVELWPPMEAITSDPPDAWKPPVETATVEAAQTRLARVVARRIRWMLDTGQRLESHGRPVRPGDVLVLVRRRGPFVEDLVRELKTLAVPVSGVDRMVLTDQLAVMDLVALGHVLLLPEDDLTLATVLKSPLLGLTEDHLFELAYGRGPGVTLWRRLADAADHAPGPFRTAHALLTELRRRADFLPPHELFAEVLGPGGGRQRLLQRLGPDAADPIDEFIQLTLAYDRAHPPSLQSFLHWLAADEQTIKRDLEEGGDAVRVMTVHGSKGLQAPVVILPDTRQVPRLKDQMLWEETENGPLLAWVARAAYREPWSQSLLDAAQARQMQEYNRLLYVALTRAEDWLIIAGWSGKTKAPDTCWYDQVERALRGRAAEIDDPWLAAEGLAGPVLRYAVAQQAEPDRTAETAHRVSGAALALPPWVTRHAPAEPSPPRPLAPSRPVTEAPPVRSPLADTDDSRFQRGRLVHRLLQFLPDLPPTRRAEAGRAFLARPLWALPETEAKALLAETLAVLDHPGFAPLFGPGSIAEASITGLISGHVVSGQVDRLLVTPDAILVIDYKTNRPPPRDPRDVPAAYLQQMAAYRAVLAGLYGGRRIECALLWTDGPFLLALPEAQLSDALTGLLLSTRKA